MMLCFINLRFNINFNIKMMIVIYEEWSVRLYPYIVFSSKKAH